MKSETMIAAGMSAPANIWPSEALVMALNSTIGTEGGMRMPSPPPAMTVPSARYRL